MHRVRWMKGLTFGALAQLYVNYVRRHYGSCFNIVFDGYKGITTKANEHIRRASTVPKGPMVDVVECNKVCYTQDRFLANDSNKADLINGGCSGVHL